MRRHKAPAAVAAIVTLAAVGALGGTASAASELPAPRITTFAAGRVDLPASGGVITLRVRTEGARACRLIFENPQRVGAVFRRSASICNGSYRISIGPNLYGQTSMAIFRYYAHDGSFSRFRRLIIYVAAAPKVAPVPTVPATTLPPSPTPVPVTPTTAPAPVPAAPPAPPSSPTTPAPGFASSGNWSGYVIPSTSIVTGVSGEWTVPTLDCSAIPNSGVSVWVGTGGYGPSTGNLLQTGIDANCVNGVQQNEAWWEELPAPGSAFVMTVSAGDEILAGVVQEANGTWGTLVEDVTTGTAGVSQVGGMYGSCQIATSNCVFGGSSAGSTYSGGTSAEWIVEDYQKNGVQVSLADYGTVAFSSLRASIPAWGLSPGDGVEMVAGTTVVSLPGPLNASGGFSVAYTG